MPKATGVLPLLPSLERQRMVPVIKAVVCMQLKHTRHALGSLKPRQAVAGLSGGIEGAAIHAI